MRYCTDESAARFALRCDRGKLLAREDVLQEHRRRYEEKKHEEKMLAGCVGETAEVVLKADACGPPRTPRAELPQSPSPESCSRSVADLFGATPRSPDAGPRSVCNSERAAFVDEEGRRYAKLSTGSKGWIFVLHDGVLFAPASSLNSRYHRLSNSTFVGVL